MSDNSKKKIEITVEQLHIDVNTYPDNDDQILLSPEGYYPMSLVTGAKLTTCPVCVSLVINSRTKGISATGA